MLHEKLGEHFLGNTLDLVKPFIEIRIFREFSACLSSLVSLIPVFGRNSFLSRINQFQVIVPYDQVDGAKLEFTRAPEIEVILRQRVKLKDANKKTKYSRGVFPR